MINPMSVRRPAILIVLSLYVLLILDLAWFQFPSGSPTANMVPLRSMIDDWRTGGRALIVNFVGNIVAFIPIGIIPAVAWPGRARPRHVALFCLSLSAVIEAVQYASGRRVADVDDLILNTAGGLLGYLLLRSSSGSRRRQGGPPDGGVLRHAGGPS